MKALLPLIFLALAACSPNNADQPDRKAAAERARAGAFGTQVKALDQARALEGQLRQEARRRDREIERQAR